jgi:amidohydrolase
MRPAEVAGVAGAVEALQPDLIVLRRDLHRHPELGFGEDRTASLVAERMRELGLVVRTGVGGTGVLADLRGERPGPLLLIRADMDALPVTEATGLEFASTVEGVMHACGHDAHVSALIGVATILAEMRDRVAGTVRFCFQPAEELLMGARRMIQDGALDGVDRVLGGHLLSMLPFGTVAVEPGPFLSGGDFFELRISGRAGHAGMPDDAVDAVYAAAQVVTALQSIVARETKPGETLVVSIAAIDGGRAANVMVEDVVLRGGVRWFSEIERERALRRIPEIAGAVCKGLRAHAEFEVTASASVIANIGDQVEVVEQAVLESGRARLANFGRFTATDDFAFFLAEAPGAFFVVGAGGSGWAPHHHPSFDVDERAIGLTTEILTRVALKALAPG